MRTLAARTASSRVLAFAAAVALISEPRHATGPDASSTDALSSAFFYPPASARPRVRWHWMNGNVTKDGISKDLEWMKRVGIGGLQNFDINLNLNTPQIADRRLAYMTPEWKDACRYAASLADLELAIASSPGFSESGGPWVQPKDGLKKVVRSATTVGGSKRFTVKLPAGPDVTGPFQGLPRNCAITALSHRQGSTEFVWRHRGTGLSGYKRTRGRTASCSTWHWRFRRCHIARGRRSTNQSLSHAGLAMILPRSCSRTTCRRRSVP